MPLMRGLRSPAAVAALALQCAAATALLLSGVVVVAALSLGSANALAHDYTLEDLRIEHPYARPTPPGARTGAAYLTIRNAGRESDRLVRVSSPVAASADLHSMTMEGNLMKMRQVSSIGIPAGTTVMLGSGGYHVMLVGLVHPLVAGGDVSLTLTFERSGSIDVSAPVVPLSMDAQSAHRH